MTRKQWIAVATAYAAIAGLGTSAGALAHEIAALEQINVTAQRREQNVQDVPVAVSAFTAAEMERRQVGETLDLVRMVPNLVGHNNTGPGSSNAYFIRGLGNTESVATFDPPVGTYVDDVYISRQSANNYALFEVERIEVLRGPQGTLFGRNTTAGAVNVITKKPSDQFEAFLEAGTGRFSRQSFRGSIDVPLSDEVLTKFSGFHQEQDGFVRSMVTNEENNDLEGYGARAAVRFLPAEGITWDIAGEYVVNNQLNLTRVCKPVTAPAADCAQGADPDLNRTGFSKQSGTGDFLSRALQGRDLGSETASTMIISNVSWDVGAVNLQFITGYRDEDWDYIIDFLPSGMAGLSLFAIANQQTTEQVTQEIKATGKITDRLDFTAGVFYIDEENETDFQDISTNFVAPILQIDRIMENGTESIAGYLQLDYALTDALAFTAGGRYTDEKKQIAYTSRMDRGALFDISTAELIAGGVPVEQNAGKFTPRVAMEFEPAAGWLWYASATKGFKSGGWNARGSAAATCQHTPLCYQAFGPEEVWSYEGGFKSELANHRLRLNANLFWSEVDDLHLVNGVTNGSTVVFITLNAGAARFRGAELEWQWLAAEQLNLYGSVGFMDAEYTSIKPSPQAQISTQTEPVRAPDLTGNLGFSYAIPTGIGEFSIGASTSYTGELWTSSSNLPAFAQVPSRWLADAQVGWTSTNQALNVSLGCKNCGDEEYLTSWFIGPYMGDPMTWELKVGYRFK